MKASTVIRIASYNVHACVGGDGEFRPDRIVDVLAEIDADIIGLQEVEDRQYGGQWVSGFLAEHLGMQAWRGPLLRRRRNDYGNLLLSRLPVENVSMHKLSQAGREPRGAVEASFTVGSRRITVITTHLGLSAVERARQIEMLLKRLENSESDIDVLMGDFNEWRPFSRGNRMLRGHFGHQRTHRTFPANRPVFDLDRILVAPGHLHPGIRVDRSAHAMIASDHLPVFAELRLS